MSKYTHTFGTAEPSDLATIFMFTAFRNISQNGGLFNVFCPVFANPNSKPTNVAISNEKI